MSLGGMSQEKYVPTHNKVRLLARAENHGQPITQATNSSENGDRLTQYYSVKAKK